MTTTNDHAPAAPEQSASTEHDVLLKRLRSLKVLLSIDSPEMRGWAPAVQQSAQQTVNAAISALKRVNAGAAPEQATPRTDSMIQPVPGTDVATGQSIDVVHADDCSTLERENADLRRRLGEAERDTTWQDHADHWQKRAIKAEAEARRNAEEVDRLKQLLSAPQIDDFLEAVRTEAAHQCERWGAENDAGKEPQDWLWLIGYLAGKALRSLLDSDFDKAQHHTISAAAACLNWHAAVIGLRTKMRPGIDAARSKP